MRRRLGSSENDALSREIEPGDGQCLVLSTKRVDAETQRMRSLICLPITSSVCVS